MYRTNDPRFRRRLNDLTQTLESANETAQSNIYVFGQNYVSPCLQSIGSCFTNCIDASCPALNFSQRDRLRRQRGRARSRGRAELNFDFYDDWDEDENDGLLGGWGNDEFDRLVAGSGAGAGGGYGTVTAQPGRQRGMSYPKARRKSAVHAGEEDPTVIPGAKGGFFRQLFGGKPLRYKPSAAGLQEHPGARRTGGRARDLTEGEALLEDDELGDRTDGRRKGRARSGTQASHETSDSYSSRGDIFPSDEEDDAIPLDDEFAMVLERRTTMSAPDTDNSSGRTPQSAKRGKRPSAGSRTSTRRTFSSRSMSLRSETGSGRRKRSSRTPSSTHTPTSEQPPGGTEEIVPMQDSVPSLADLKREEAQIADDEEADVRKRRMSAQKAAAERGFITEDVPEEVLSSKEATPLRTTPAASVKAPSVKAPSVKEGPVETQTDEEEEDDTTERPDTAIKDGKA